LGLAAASSAGITAYTIILFVILIRKTSGSGMRGLMSFFTRVTLASAIGGFVCWEFVEWLGGRISWKTFHGAFIDLSAGTIVGMILTIIFLHLFGVKEVKGYLRRIALRFTGAAA
jgi:peptidoglycan biosynthesis protein MviN/MurJ (putative lipid II flippase)